MKACYEFIVINYNYNALKIFDIIIYIFVVCDVKFSKVVDKCYLAYSENLHQSIDEWTAAGPNRFYFNEAYDVEKKIFDDPPYKAISISEGGKSNCNSKLKSKKAEDQRKTFVNKPTEYKMISRKLKTLDVFAGCGGKYLLNV